MTRASRVVPPPGATVPERHPDAPAPGEVITSHYPRCFCCGDDHPTGLRMHITAGEGLSITALLTVTEDHQGTPGLAHGGLLASAFDESLGSVNWLLRRPAVTRRLETEFRRPVPVGSTLYITAQVTGVAGRMIYTKAVGCLGEPQGAIAAQAMALYVVVPLEHFRAHGRAEDVTAAFASPTVIETVQAFEVNT